MSFIRYTLCFILYTLYRRLSIDVALDLYTVYCVHYTLHFILYTLYFILYTLYEDLYVDEHGTPIGSDHSGVLSTGLHSINCKVWGMKYEV